MIVRERVHTFVMIEQHHHASISGKLYDAIKKAFTIKNNCDKKSVRTAIYQHDIGWEPFDASPMWNDKKQKPFDFISMPNTIKSVLYKNGINKVELEDHLAALLCSHHYVRFLQKSTNNYSKQFIQAEASRQSSIIQALECFNQEDFLAYYELIQFFDNLSLYICLHEFNPTKEDVHFFFKDGIELPKLYGGGKLELNRNNHSIILNTPLFTNPVQINLQQKIVKKSTIKEIGVLKAWNATSYETIHLTIE